MDVGNLSGREKVWGRGVTVQRRKWEVESRKSKYISHHVSLWLFVKAKVLLSMQNRTIFAPLEIYRPNKIHCLSQFIEFWSILDVLCVYMHACVCAFDQQMWNEHRILNCSEILICLHNKFDWEINWSIDWLWMSVQGIRSIE